MRLEAHLTGPDGQVSAQLRPLLGALASADSPRGVLCWLQRSPNAQLLGELAAAGQPLSHDLLDELPPSRYEHYVRQTLVHTGALPERHEELERIATWLDQLLADRPAEHARLIRPFVHWFLLKRARRRATQRRHPAMAGSYLRTRIRVALELLTWLDEHELDLEHLTQERLERWLTAANTRTYTIRYFLSWAAGRSIAPRLTVPAIPRQEPERILNDDERWDQLKWCLNEQSLALDVRAAGAIVLLFGLSTSRIRHLRAEHLHVRDGDTYLDLGLHPMLVPPKLAALLHSLPTTRSANPGSQRRVPVPDGSSPAFSPADPPGPPGSAASSSTTASTPAPPATRPWSHSSRTSRRLSWPICSASTSPPPSGGRPSRAVTGPTTWLPAPTTTRRGNKQPTSSSLDESLAVETPRDPDRGPDLHERH
ncbi:hypothetical protein [Streptomyces phaeochromogenes]